MKIQLISVLFPVLGLLGLPYIGGAWLVRLALSGGKIILLARLPGLVGGLYWSVAHWSIRLLVPIACMVLFLSHPTGAQAWGYPLFWLIPIGIYVCSGRSIVANALASTFITHAVGSVIYLYSFVTAPDYWWGLMPVVVFERALFAAVMVLIYIFASLIRAQVQRYPWSNIWQFRWTATVDGLKSKG
jgi:hypothetical protein